MMNIKTLFSKKYGLFYFLIILAVITRLLPHPMNFTPIGAIGLYVGAYAQDRRAWLTPIVALFISDLFIDFYNPVIMLSVYVSFMLSAIVGRFVLAKKHTVLRVGGSAVASATILFIISNFALWATGLYYPLTYTGLVQCYVMAIPFYGNGLLGDLFYSALIFGVHEAVKHWLERWACPSAV